MKIATEVKFAPADSGAESSACSAEAKKAASTVITIDAATEFAEGRIERHEHTVLYQKNALRGPSFR